MTATRNSYHPLEPDNFHALDGPDPDSDRFAYPPPPIGQATPSPKISALRTILPTLFFKPRVRDVRWDQRRFMLVIPILAAVLQTVLLVGSIYVTIHPWVIPYDDYMGSWTEEGKITVKEYNIFVSLVGAGISATSGLALAIGAKGYIAQRLASRGISLEAYEAFRKMGESQPLTRASVYALVPVALFILSNSAAPAIISLWQAGTSHVDLTIETSFTSFAATFDFQTAVAEQSRPLEYDSLVYHFYEDLRITLESGYNPLNQAEVEVDGTSAPWLLNGVSTVLPTGSDAMSLEAWISYLGEHNHKYSLASSRPPSTPSDGSSGLTKVTMSSSNTVQLTVPLVVAQSSCSHPSSLLTTNFTSTDDGAVRALVEDQLHCPGTTWDLIYGGGEIMSSAISCMHNTTSAYTGYFFINATDPSSPSFVPLASCLTTVTAGTRSGITISDGSPTIDDDDRLPSSAVLIQELEHRADATALSQSLVARMWGNQSQGGRGSIVLNRLVNLSNEYGEVYDFGALTGAMASMAVSKQVYAETAAANKGALGAAWMGYSLSGTVTPAFITCTCLKVGPDSWEALYLGVVAAMWLAVLLALAVSIHHPPVSLDPLDPISMLLIAQNSPPSAELEGGCTGDVDRLRSRNVKMRLCAVDSERLGFVFGDDRKLADLPSPVIGLPSIQLATQRSLK